MASEGWIIYSDSSGREDQKKLSPHTVCDLDNTSLSEISMFLTECSAVTFFSSKGSNSFSELLSFAESLEKAREQGFTDPEWFVVNIFGSKFGKGSRELLVGHSVDPKCNPVHRHCVQYLADTGLLAVASHSYGEALFVASVSYFDEKQESLNKIIFQSCRPYHMFLIVLAPSTVTASGEFEYPESGERSVIYISLRNPRIADNLRVMKGATIAVVLGTLDPVFNHRNPSNGPSLNAQISMKSKEYTGLETTNRRTQTRGQLYPHVACPDCRRPIELQKVIEEPRYEASSSSDTIIVTVVCDEEEAISALEAGLCAVSRYSQRVLYVTSSSLLNDDLQSAYTSHGLVKALTRWPKKRGMKEYSVPDGYVSPALLPKGTDINQKDSMYTIIQALGRPELWGKTIWLVEPSGENGIEVTPTKSMYGQMILELREWSHPCHRARSSAVCFIREWINTYSKC
jgi:hypothetical protein